ncbi:acyl carrier protein [Myxococcota bacterium]|nr:acyl carrier protein [Myxococcota bacterium]
MSDSVNEKIRALVCDQLGVAPNELTEDANILDDLGADSLDVVELVMSIEEAFEIEIADEEAETLRTLGDVERFVTSRVAA